MTQEELAERANLSARTVSDLERGAKLRPHRGTVQMLAAGLSLSAGELAELQRAAHGFAAARPHVAPGSAPPRQPDHNLPFQTTTFVGRVAELERLGALLRRPPVRLVTLTGPGGSGKTRLALEAAHALLAEFADGVYFVDLAPISDKALVSAQLAQTLGLKETGEPPIAGLKAFLRDKHMLLLLDNCEQVLEGAAQVAELLAAAGGLKVLATSRAPLRIRGEHNLPVPPLAVPSSSFPIGKESLAENEAVRLFVERASEVNFSFALTEENVGAVAEIVRRLDGLPLAIELAATRVNLLPPPVMLARFDSRLMLLTGHRRDVLARQRTLRSAIEWSYDLLDDIAKLLFRRLAVFHGGATLEAVEIVCKIDSDSDVDFLGAVQNVLDSSLLKHAVGTASEPRFSMLETIREYAREKLQESGEANGLARRHAEYFSGLIEDAQPGLKGAHEVEWLARLESEHDNLRAALDWSLEDASDERLQRLEIGLQIGGACWKFWEMRTFLSEGRVYLAALLARYDAVVATVPRDGEREGLKRARAIVLSGAGRLTAKQGDLLAAHALYEQSLTIFRQLDDKSGIAGPLHGLGNIACAQGDYAVARTLYEESLAISRTLGDKFSIGASLSNLGTVAFAQGDHAAARALYEEGLAIGRTLGNKYGIARSLVSLGTVAWVQGDYAAARALYEESLTIFLELGDKYNISSSLGNLANVAFAQGDHAAARALYQESLTISRTLGDKYGIAWSLSNLGTVAHAQGDYAAARALCEESLAISRESGYKYAISRSLLDLGNLAQEQGDYKSARTLYEESLALKRELGDKLGIASSLAGVGGVAVGTASNMTGAASSGAEGSMGSTEQGSVERGTRVLGAVEVLLQTIGSVLPLEDRIPYERSITTAHAKLGEEVFKRAWEQGRDMSMEQAVAYALEEVS